MVKVIRLMLSLVVVFWFVGCGGGGGGGGGDNNSSTESITQIKNVKIKLSAFKENKESIQNLNLVSSRDVKKIKDIDSNGLDFFDLNRSQTLYLSDDSNDPKVLAYISKENIQKGDFDITVESIADGVIMSLPVLLFSDKNTRNMTLKQIKSLDTYESFKILIEDTLQNMSEDGIYTSEILNDAQTLAREVLENKKTLKQTYEKSSANINNWIFQDYNNNIYVNNQTPVYFNMNINNVSSILEPKKTKELFLNQNINYNIQINYDKYYNGFTIVNTILDVPYSTSILKKQVENNKQDIEVLVSSIILESAVNAFLGLVEDTLVTIVLTAEPQTNLVYLAQHIKNARENIKKISTLLKGTDLFLTNIIYYHISLNGCIQLDSDGKLIPYCTELSISQLNKPFYTGEINKLYFYITTNGEVFADVSIKNLKLDCGKGIKGVRENPSKNTYSCDYSDIDFSNKIGTLRLKAIFIDKNNNSISKYKTINIYHSVNITKPYQEKNIDNNTFSYKWNYNSKAPITGADLYLSEYSDNCHFDESKSQLIKEFRGQNGTWSKSIEELLSLKIKDKQLKKDKTYCLNLIPKYEYDFGIVVRNPKHYDSSGKGSISGLKFIIDSKVGYFLPFIKDQNGKLIDNIKFFIERYNEDTKSYGFLDTDKEIINGSSNTLKAGKYTLGFDSKKYPKVYIYNPLYFDIKERETYTYDKNFTIDGKFSSINLTLHNQFDEVIKEFDGKVTLYKDDNIIKTCNQKSKCTFEKLLKGKYTLVIEDDELESKVKKELVLEASETKDIIEKLTLNSLYKIINVNVLDTNGKELKDMRVSLYDSQGKLVDKLTKNGTFNKLKPDTYTIKLSYRLFGNNTKYKDYETKTVDLSGTEKSYDYKPIIDTSMNGGSIEVNINLINRDVSKNVFLSLTYVDGLNSHLVDKIPIDKTNTKYEFKNLKAGVHVVYIYSESGDIYVVADRITVQSNKVIYKKDIDMLKLNTSTKFTESLVQGKWKIDSDNYNVTFNADKSITGYFDNYIWSVNSNGELELTLYILGIPITTKTLTIISSSGSCYTVNATETNSNWHEEYEMCIR